MDDRTKRNVIFAVAVLASSLAIALRFAPEPAPIEAAQTVDGEVIAVEAASSNDKQGEAVVKLASGETVRAVVPTACLLVPGQMARLSRVDRGMLSSTYLVRNAWDKK